MNIHSAVIEATNILKDKSILSAQLDSEILMAKALDKDREYIILNHDKILNNENLDAKINFNVKNIYDFDRFSDLSLKLRIEQGKITFSNSQVNWKDNIDLSFEDSILDFEKEKINLNGKIVVNIKDKNDFYRSFQINKDLRKDLKKIEFDFNYDFNEKKVYFDNLRLDNKTNENLDKLSCECLI